MRGLIAVALLLLSGCNATTPGTVGEPHAPELNATTKADDAECGAKGARDALAGLLAVGTSVVLNGLKGEPATDRYGRTLSNVYVAVSGSTVNVSLWLVAEGWARVYAAYPTSDGPEARMLQRQAQDAHRGMWASC